MQHSTPLTSLILFYYSLLSLSSSTLFLTPFSYSLLSPPFVSSQTLTVHQMINRCIEEEGVPKSRYIGIPSPHNFEENLLAYAPADAEIGACLFFKGVSLSHLDRLGEALECFLLALDSPWAVEIGERQIPLRFNLRDEQDRRGDSVREHNRMICLFAVAKTLQREKKHLEAIEYFTKALEVLPLDKDIAFVHFRRAWSYKVSRSLQCCI